MKRLIALSVVLVALSVAITTPANAGNAARAPVFPKTLNGHVWIAPTCNSQHRMDIYVDEFGVIWECQCQWLQTGNICTWVEVGETDVDAIRIRRKIRLGTLPKHFYYSVRYRHYWVIP